MADTLDELDELLARANAAIAEATRLIEENRAWQANIAAGLRRMRFRITFRPKTLRFLSPLDFPDRRQVYQPFPNQEDV
jgi:hypothetical protein